MTAYSTPAEVATVQAANEAFASNWRELFDTFDDFEKAPPISFAVRSFLQNDAITAIAGLAGNSKTWVALDLTRALLFGPGKFWDLFDVVERAERVIYLIPESSRVPFKARLKVTSLYDELYSDRLLVRTLSKGPAPDLSDVRLLRAAKGAHVILDTAIRFMYGDESNAGEMAKGLSDDMLGLLRAEARSVIPLFHSPKAFAAGSSMTLESMIRGSSELGAVLATAWGIRQIDESANTLHIENIKARDFEHCGPFQIIGRPHIDQSGGFALHKSPGDCGPLSDEQPEPAGNGASSKLGRQARSAHMAMVKMWLRSEPNLSSSDLREKFKAEGIEIPDGTVRNYKFRALKKAP